MRPDPRPRVARLAGAALCVLLAAVAGAAQTGPVADDLFDDGVLHDVRLTMNPRDWESLKANFQFNDYYPAHFTWNGVTARNVGIRSRGLGSRSGTKPGLRVDFDRYSGSQTFLGLTQVVLRNNTQDASSLHERVSMRLFTLLGVPASRTAHARLFVNDQYVGLYLIVESVDKRFLQRHYAENDGYLYKFEWTEAYYFESRGPDPASYSPQPFQPETREKDPDPRPLVDLVAAIEQSTDLSFMASVSPHIDVGAFVTQAAIENFLADNDGLVGYAGLNNFYLYRSASTRRATVIPWDKSEAFKAGPVHPIWSNILDVPSWLRNRLMDRAMNVPELRDRYLDTLLSAASVASAGGWFEQEIRRAYVQIREAALADPLKPFSNEQFEEDVLRMIEFARTRPAFVIEDVRRSR